MAIHKHIIDHTILGVEDTPFNDGRYLKLTGGSLVPTADSTTTFQIFQQDGTTNVFNVDTTNGRVGIGTVAPVGQLHINSTTQLEPKISITGQEFYQAANTSTDGIAILLGVNRTNNRQLWIGDTSKLASSATNTFLRVQLPGTYATVDAVATDGATKRPLILNAGGGLVGIGTTLPTSTLSFDGTAARTIALERHTTANTGGNSLTVQAGGATSGATNKAGGNLILSSGTSTGTATSQIQLFLPTASTGTTDNAPSVKGYIVPSTNGCSLILSSSTTGNATGINFNGNVAQNLLLLRHTTANTDGNSLTIQAGGATSAATDKAGGDLTLKGGIATGTGSSAIRLFTATAQASTNTTDNAPTEKLTILGNGYVGIGATTPTAKLSVAEKSAMNADGGFMVKLTNRTGANTVKGHVVHSSSANDNSAIKVTDGVPDAIGVFYEDGVADGAEAWVVVSGIADVYFIGNTTRGHLARTFLTGEAGYVTGQALSEAVPTPPFDTDKHFCEIGHVLASRTGAGLSKCLLHFN